MGRQGPPGPFGLPGKDGRPGSVGLPGEVLEVHGKSFSAAQKFFVLKSLVSHPRWMSSEKSFGKGLDASTVYRSPVLGVSRHLLLCQDCNYMMECNSLPLDFPPSFLSVHTVPDQAEGGSLPTGSVLTHQKCLPTLAKRATFGADWE